ncbi:MAG: hypothetical protein NTZ29_17515, partial [Verrucomicrobia bacterium]|nr:hypothetical protein [Verrucomicrobiota bacterium]
KDLVQAHAWFNLAAAAGDGFGEFCLGLVEKEMTPDQKAEATELARELFEVDPVRWTTDRGK